MQTPIKRLIKLLFLPLVLLFISSELIVPVSAISVSTVRTLRHQQRNNYHHSPLLPKNKTHQANPLPTNHINSSQTPSKTTRYTQSQIILVSDIEGYLYGLDKDTGEILWCINDNGEDSESLDWNKNVIKGKVSSGGSSWFRPLVHVSRDKSKKEIEEKEEDTDLVWIIEPYDEGSLYIFHREEQQDQPIITSSNPSYKETTSTGTGGGATITGSGVSMLPISIARLVNQSPFVIKDRESSEGTQFDDKVYTGVRKTELFQLDLLTGEILSSFGNSGECPVNNKGSRENVINIGRTTYELTIHSTGINNDNETWNVTYTTWTPNTIDLVTHQHRQLQHLNSDTSTPISSTYFSPFHDSSLLAINPEAEISYKWVSRLPSTVVNVFDVMIQSTDTAKEEGHKNNYIILPHPLKPLTVDTETNSDPPTVYLDQTSQGSWYALSWLNYPALVKSAPMAKYVLSERWRRIKHDPEVLKGVHYLNMDHQPTGSTGALILNHDKNSMIGLPYYSHEYNNAPLLLPIYGSDIESYNAGDAMALPPSTIMNCQPEQLELGPSPQLTIDASTSWLVRFLVRFAETLLMIIMTFVFVWLVWKYAGIKIDLKEVLKDNGLVLQELEVSGELEDQEEGQTKIEEEDEASEEQSVNVAKHSEENTVVALKKRKRGSRGGKKVKAAGVAVSGKTVTSKPQSLIMTPPTTSSSTISLDYQPQLHTIQLSNDILGYGSQGTIVYRGSFQSRPVAVKRILLDYHHRNSTLAIANSSSSNTIGKETDLESELKEISILTESDSHENVIRYYYHETVGKFLYIALELCDGSIEDVVQWRRSHYVAMKSKTVPISDYTTSSSEIFNTTLLTTQWDPLDIMAQIAEGVRHLHSLRIVHRDIKPQNILIVPVKKQPLQQQQQQQQSNKNSSTNKNACITDYTVRVLISDFGLCKKLEHDESYIASINHQNQMLNGQKGAATAAGTSGWRAPELLLACSISPSALSRSVDIFSLGCVYHYILTDGIHPFGNNPYSRDLKIIEDTPEMSLLSNNGDNMLHLTKSAIIESSQLITSMIHHKPKERPKINEVLKHPLFWKDTEKLGFLISLSDRLELEKRDNSVSSSSPVTSELLKRFESKIAPQVLTNNKNHIIDWTCKFEPNFLTQLSKYRKYSGQKITDLLRALRNKYHHFNELPSSLQREYCSYNDTKYGENNGKIDMNPVLLHPEGIYGYFIMKFPKLFMSCYLSVMTDEVLREDHVLKRYY